MKTFKLFIFMIAFSAFAGYSQNTQPLQASETQVLVNVSVSNFQNVPRAKEIITFEGKKTKKIFTGISDKDGKFSLLLPKNETFNIKYIDFIDSTEYSEMEVTDKPGVWTMQLNIQIEPAVSKTYTLENVFFDTNLSTLKPASFKALNDLVEILKLKPTMVIEISGHTDNTGSTDINQKLSQSRAESVMNYLIKKGITAKRLTAIGFGDTQPIAENTTEEGRQKNRRTQVRIVKE